MARGGGGSSNNNIDNDNGSVNTNSQQPPRYIDVAIEMTGNPKVGSNAKPTCKKLAKSPTSLRFIVQKLPLVIDSPLADHVTSLLLDELGRLPVPGRVAKILLSSVKMTEEGALTLQGFFESQASTIRHVALHNVLQKMTLDDGADAEQVANVAEEWGLDCDYVLAIMEAFEHAPLQVLDLSRNVLHGKDIWQSWTESQQRQQAPNSSRSNNNNNNNIAVVNNGHIKQLILDSVDLDHDSWTTLQHAFCWEALDDLHMVLEQAPPTDHARHISNAIVQQCTKLSSLRWIQKRNPEGPLPWTGLRDMTREVLNHTIHNGSGSNSKTNNNHPDKGGNNLRHLVLEGPGTHDFCQSHHMSDLAAALEGLPRLRTLKLRHLGLTDLASICVALRAARPPLEVLDCSYNEVSSAGAHRLADLSRVPKIAHQLQLIVLNDNRLETNVARELLELYPNSISLDNNPQVDFCRIVTEVMTASKGLERERNELRQQLEQRAYEAGGQNAEILQKENKRLREERDMLARAFSIIGISHEVEEHKKLLDRLQRLEDIMLLGAVFKGGGGGAAPGIVTVGSGGGGGGDGTPGSRTTSRRRINASDLQAYAAAGGRNPSNRSLQPQRGGAPIQRGRSGALTRGDSNRSLRSAVPTSGGDDIEAGGPTLEAPSRPITGRNDRDDTSTTTNNRRQGRSYTRTPTQGQRDTVGSSRGDGGENPPSAPELGYKAGHRSGSGRSSNGGGSSGDDRLEPSLRRTNYTSERSPGTNKGRRDSASTRD